MINNYSELKNVKNMFKHRFHVMAKPIGSTCNLRCTYCYYLSKSTLLSGAGNGRISDELLERFIRQYINGVTADEVVFSWQGGEPALLGIEFFEKVISLEKKFAKPGQSIHNDLQTNGTLINEQWCEFLKKNNFLVGLSIDGPNDIHTLYRKTKTFESSFESVYKTAKLLKQYDIPFNTLTCVHRHNAKRPLDVYRFLRRDVGSTYIQFIPIVEYKGFEKSAPHFWNTSLLPIDGEPGAYPGNDDSIVTEWSVDPDDWGYFLSKTFDEWRNRDLGRVLVNHFETLVARHLGLPSQICIYSKFCGKAMAMEYDGNVYSCDHYVYPEYRLGNINDTSLGDIAFSTTQMKFGNAKHEQLPSYCRECAYLDDCWGECPKNRIIRTASQEAGLNYLCRGLKRFFHHAVPYVDQIVKSLQKQPLRLRKRM